jgi:tRNA nucleotidyltransferase (CCA-adding enzyme)
VEIYLVGGAVRDKLLGRTSTEQDWVVVGSSPDEMLGLGFKAVGKEFPVFLHPTTHEEYALARTEKKVGPGYGGFQFYTSPTVTLEADLLRRDLTINAMAMRADGSLIDPYHGREDLQAKILRHVSKAFVEDPVRILRVARFYARFASLGFQIAPETIQLMRKMVQHGEVDALVPERIWQETEKALGEEACEKFFEALRACGALKPLFPELDRLFGVPNALEWHPEIDSGIHTLLVLQQAIRLSPKPTVRFAALLHDLGKGTTDLAEWPNHPGHEERGIDLTKTLCQRLRVPKQYRELAILATGLHGLVHKALALSAKEILQLIEKADALRRPERFKDFLLTCHADACGRPGYENDPYPQADFLTKIVEQLKTMIVDPELMQRLAGSELANALREQRLEIIKACLVRGQKTEDRGQRTL